MEEPAGTCTGCGRPLRADAEFCGYCGTKAPERRLAAVPPSPVPEPEPEPIPLQPEPESEPDPVAPAPEPERESEPAFVEPLEPETPSPAFDPEVEPADDDEPSEGVSYAELYAAADTPEPRQPREGASRFRLALTLALLGLLLICIAAYLVNR